MTESLESAASARQARGPAGHERIAVRWLPLEALSYDKRNARVHSARQIARIADSIAAFGFNVPVLVDDRGGVLAGHGRALAAKRLGLKEVPTIALDHLDKAERRAFMIADNRLAELASWDDVRLGLELKELKTLDLDFSLSATGFTIGEIDLRIEAGRESGARKPKPRAAPRRGSAGAQPGDVWTLGSSRLICGDDLDDKALFALDAAIRRWEAAAGEGARLDSSGETFAAATRAAREPLPQLAGEGGAERRMGCGPP
jgi:ParB-like chromosome segregation protein Spo0J